MSFPYPFFQIQYKADGTIFLQSEVTALMTGAEGVTDLFVMAHGWNNNIADALDLYQGLTNLFQQQIAANAGLASRKFAIAGILWPSKKFEDKDLIPSGAAALNDAVTIDQLKSRVADLGVLSAASDWPAGGGTAIAGLDELAGLMDGIEDDPSKQTRAIDLMRAGLVKDQASTDDGSDKFLTMKNSLLVERLSKSLNPPVASAKGAASVADDPFSTGATSGLGGAAGFRDVLGGIKSAFLNALNYTTYYIMKARAGTVGVTGLCPLLIQLRDKNQALRIHLVGHSFGCRLVSAAINAMPEGEQFRPDTALLLQGAFSHNGFANPGDETDRGAFRDVVEKKKVRGPILITHTRADKAVGVAYPIASRINGVTAAALGDENDIYGGLGSNGAQTPETTPERMTGTLLPVGSAYPFADAAPSTPCNLKADGIIGGHSDIRKPEVAYALSVALAAKSAMTVTS
jgi:hypothetical protein